MPIRYGSYNLFRRKARGKYTGRNRRSRYGRYRRRRMSRRAYLWKGTNRRFVRKVKRSYKDVKRQSLALSYYIQGAREYFHKIAGLEPDLSDMDKVGATGWCRVMPIYSYFIFNDQLDEVSRSSPWQGPIRGSKVHMRNWNINITFRPGFHQTASTNQTGAILASASIGYRVRIILFSIRSNAFAQANPPVSDADKFKYIIQPTADIPFSGESPTMLDWGEFVGNTGTLSGLNMYARYLPSPDGTYHIWRDKIYSYSGIRPRTIRMNIGPRILDFEHVTGSADQIRTPRLSLLIIYDVSQPTSVNPAHNPDCQFTTVVQSGINYSLL